MAAGGSAGLTFGPAGEDLLQRDDDVVEDDPQKRERDENGEHQRVVRVGLAAVEQRAQAAAVGRHDLHQVCSDERERDGDLQGAEELWQGFRQGNLPEDRHL